MGGFAPQPVENSGQKTVPSRSGPMRNICFAFSLDFFAAGDGPRALDGSATLIVIRFVKTFEDGAAFPCLYAG